MTISTTTIKNSYLGNNTNLDFTYTFKITDEDEIQVIVRNAAGNETTKVKTTNYTVSGVGNAGGGTVSFVSGQAPLSTETVLLRRSTPQTQGMDLIENDPLPADTLENAHDKIISIAQELQEQVDRSLKLSKTTTINSTEFTEDAAARANKVLTFDSLGELTVEQELGSNRGNWSAGVAYAERDIVKDTSNNNVYYCLVAHTSQGSTPLSSNADIAKWSLLIDAEAATNSANQAAASASTAIANAALTTVDAATATTQSGLAQAAATAAATSEANSLTYSQNSLSSATASANSASAASTSETNAAASAASAAASSGGGAVKASTTDTTPGFLDQKFNVGLGLKKEIQNSGANETFTISSNALVLAIALGG